MTFIERLRVALRLLRDPRVPRLPRYAVLAAVVYAIWPIDLIPDWVTGVFGWVDDLVLLWLSLRWLFHQRRNEPRRE